MAFLKSIGKNVKLNKVKKKKDVSSPQLQNYQQQQIEAKKYDAWLRYDIIYLCVFLYTK